MSWLVRSIAAAALCLLVVLAVLGIMAPWSPSAWFLIGAGSVLALSALLRERRPRRGLALVALGLLLTISVVRLWGGGEGTINMVTLPGGQSSRWLGRLIEEQDIAVTGARALAIRWRLPADERPQIVPALRKAYAEMRWDDAFSPSPVLDTMLGRQRPESFDAVVIDPRPTTASSRAPDAAVLFLHGYGGGHTLECWLVARAARAIGALTVCPSLDFQGRWSSEAGRRTVEATLGYLRRRGIERVVLAGLSNGAAGAVALAPGFAPALSGLLLLSGAPASGTAAGLPCLVVHGLRDTMAPAKHATSFAERNGADYAGLDGGHFVLLIEREQGRQAIAAWLEKRWASWRAADKKNRS